MQRGIGGQYRLSKAGAFPVHKEQDVQANQYLESRAADCRKLARKERQPDMARALLDLADVYERQLQCGTTGRPSKQMR